MGARFLFQATAKVKKTHDGCHANDEKGHSEKNFNDSESVLSHG
jgi:hypothetical protein